MRLYRYSKGIQKTGTLTQDLMLEMLASIQMQSHLQLGKQFIYEIPTPDLADWKFSKIPILQSLTELEHTIAVHNNFFLPLSIVREGCFWQKFSGVTDNFATSVLVSRAEQGSDLSPFKSELYWTNTLVRLGNTSRNIRHNPEITHVVCQSGHQHSVPNPPDKHKVGFGV